MKPNGTPHAMSLNLSVDRQKQETNTVPPTKNFETFFEVQREDTDRDILD